MELPEAIKNRCILQSYIYQGWINLLLELDERISNIAPEYEIIQFKENLGSLKFYVSSSKIADVYPNVLLIISGIESLSIKTCCVCGEGGSRIILPNGNFTSPFCMNHTESQKLSLHVNPKKI